MGKRGNIFVDVFVCGLLGEWMGEWGMGGWVVKSVGGWEYVLSILM